ncbi:hypothetical protein NDK43_06705 [Neobacillus pocheonensis]|uniref:Uncharacterized protein n=1 Tax=Neobacillus pocheonensis TaxID=363869 RepID=A0ABT0W9K7_9BACI|nr:hypothetical protein [Neobacillus pocheonensis]
MKFTVENRLIPYVIANGKFVVMNITITKLGKDPKNIGLGLFSLKNGETSFGASNGKLMVVNLGDKALQDQGLSSTP